MKCKLSKRELEIVRRFQNGWPMETIVDPSAHRYVGTRAVERIIRKALIHQRVTDHGRVYYDRLVEEPRRGRKR